MTLSVGITNGPDGLTVAMTRLYTGEHSEPNESRLLCDKICNMLEPAIYEAVKDYVKHGGIPRVEIKWDDQTFRIKGKHD